ncbi:cytosine permease [Alicyclobacillus tolerans]|uniref:purine-cytosine permease family protein n=1 Tax=Alicyclobacillus tolerans TaxID=90970 RepID=UPI001F02BDF2|nr:cytosine permease [Alicyclobacillus tolerans]MCF8568126.1 cytosine permease [Alicyclobacillus tolerans]
MSTVKINADQIGSEQAVREDYALRQVPLTWRYSSSSLVVSLLGGATAGFFLALPGELAGSFGVWNVLIGMVVAVVIQTLINYVFVNAAARTGLSSDLMSRGLALGFDGSAWTTLVYWFTWVAYFATEGQILGSAVTEQLGIPTWLSYLIVGIAFIPLVLYGIRFMVKFQRWTLYLYLIAMIALLIKVLMTPHVGSLISSQISNSKGMTIGGLGFLGVMASYIGLIGNVTFGHADMGRLMATERSLKRGASKGALWISLIPYSIGAYFVAGILGLLFWAVTNGNTNPGSYFVQLLGISGFILIIITQLRINLVNGYSGSLSLANFFSRLNFTPGRSFWAIIMVVIGTMMMYGNVLGHLAQVLNFEGVFLSAWIGVIFTDYVFLRGKHKFGPHGGQFIEYRRAMLPHWNKVGVTALIVSTLVGAVLAFGSALHAFGGPVLEDLSSLITFIVAGVLTYILGLRDQGKSYSIRPLIAWPREDKVVECPIDHEVVSTSDMFPCPFHKTWICSHDCMGTRNCGELCKNMTTEELLKIELPPLTDYLREANSHLATDSSPKDISHSPSMQV